MLLASETMSSPAAVAGAPGEPLTASWSSSRCRQVGIRARDPSNALGCPSFLPAVNCWSEVSAPVFPPGAVPGDVRNG